MALEPLKSPGLAEAQFALPAVGDPKAKGALQLGVLPCGAAAVHLMDRNHLSSCILSFLVVQYFQLPPKKPNQ